MKELMIFVDFDGLNESAIIPEHINKQIVLEALECTNDQVISLPAKTGVKRFSIVADQVEFVTVCNVDKTHKQIATCHSTQCRLSKNQSTKRNVRNLTDCSSLCQHLKLLKESFDEVPTRMEMDIEVDDGNYGDSSDEDDTLPSEKWEDIFDVACGLWTFGKNCPSTQIVDSNPNSNNLSIQFYQRSRIDIKEPETFPLFVPSANGTCTCQAGWTSDENPDGLLEEVGKTTLFLSLGAVEAKVWKRKCLQGTCMRSWTGEDECIFRLSAHTCAGYEIGWMFVDAVNSGKQTFSGFTMCMNKTYKRLFPTGKSFMSSRTFIAWWFAWASHMKIDFRMSCSWCGGKCSSLACDGTKIGLNFKQAFVSPIERSNESEILETKLRRLDRCFIPTSINNTAAFCKLARDTFQQMCRFIIDGDYNQISSLMFKEYVQLLDDRVVPFISRVFNIQQEGIDRNEQLAAAKLLSMLFTDCSVDVICPIALAEKLNSFFSTSSMDTLAFAEDVKTYCPEMAWLMIQSFLVHNGTIPEDTLSFFVHVCERVKSIHSFNTPPAPTQKLEGTYNPAKYGRAYYFTENGEQIRKMRSFSMDKREIKDTANDDTPDVRCRKVYPDVSKKGTTYLFLWFCPYHGHCLGFHIITGSEGRKDALASLYTHLEKGPETIFYDFACGLSEYAKNRESGYFQDTRFFHDVFHGFSHKCSQAYNSSRLSGMNSPNTSICEQFNSFLQRIKASAKLMGQAHFTFYVQFFIHQWNIKVFNSSRTRMKIGYYGAFE
ncbi:uncharacterized protein LOC130623486 [Hydractinia symbiolongicarpus]|uniref:uncharacterized protein LOC130623486 n=1 Tax=Hydractinia symbiolongicarpus TaxID=13093 RepID=UPI00254DC00A|nr:uncharacterized protein LOC130623486 [Hydractinia symbiolongicarpus]